MNLLYQKFSEINLTDPFFDSLKLDYAEFPAWFARKSEERAYVFRDEPGNIAGFLYLKSETEGVDDVTPKLPPGRRIKVGTMKINPHGTRLGERFVKKIFDHALENGIPEIYVTVFEKHEGLIRLYQKYGFFQAGTKTTANGTELVFVKRVLSDGDTILHRYPVVQVGGQAIYLLSIQPQWHTRLLPDSILRTEDSSIVQDVSHTNSIHKVYLAAMRGMENLKVGDVLLIYRTSDGQGPAEHRSVVTSVCVVEEYKNISGFSDSDAFLRYCEPYSVFEHDELSTMWRTKKYPHIVRFTYNFALPKRITRHHLITNHGLDRNAYAGFTQLSANQLASILAASQTNENLTLY